VEDTATIEIEKIYNGNLLQDRKFVKAIPYQGLDGDKITLEAIEKLIENSDLNIMEYNATEETSVVTETMVDKEEAGALGNSSPLQKEKNISSIRVSSDKLDELMNLVSELVTTQAGLSLFSENNHNPTLESIAENVEKLSRQLRDIAFTMTLIPINNLFGRFQRMIRDVSHNLNKSVSFITQGGETELDKTIIEQLTDPLLHLLRNSLDHGIETPEERIKAGKSPTGKITLRSYYSGVNVFIQIEDDGKGIDSDEIRSSAIKKGLIDSSDELSEKEIFDLIFAAGFSTAKKVTDVSGRGVGMDVVRRNIADIRGEITIDSKPGKGTLITLKLPLTLSIIDGLLVKIYDTFYLIPLSVVSKCYEVTQEDLDDDFNRVVILDGEQIPFINLRKNFDVTEDAPDFFQLIVVENEGRKVGITVDTIIGEYQAVLKPLGKYYKHQDFISGGTILGDGTIALVMDTGKIVYKFLSETKEEHV
ncbi:MAG: chemotaxis protein CheA, partial [Cyclobacteriaceae bacterium]|nr:chemotaxis protein CheA [Cyclobacteriaceae bacterium]